MSSFQERVTASHLPRSAPEIYPIAPGEACRSTDEDPARNTTEPRLAGASGAFRHWELRQAATPNVQGRSSTLSIRFQSDGCSALVMRAHPLHWGTHPPSTKTGSVGSFVARHW